MKRRMLLAALAVLILGSERSAADTPRSITVIGDSHAKGLAFALRRLLPGRDIRDLSVGGTGSWQMFAAPDDGSLVVVSAGTVDCGTRDPDDKMVASVLRVLGPFVEGTQKNGGHLVYIQPHARIRGEYAYVNPRIKKLNEKTTAALDGHTGVSTVTMDEEVGVDGLHLDPSGYDSLAKRAVAALGD